MEMLIILYIIFKNSLKCISCLEIEYILTIHQCFTLNFNLNNPIINFVLKIIIAFEKSKCYLFSQNERKLH